MNERELLVDCLRRLNRTGVIYYLTGSMASNYWGTPRTTHDLDFVVQFPTAAVTRIEMGDAAGVVAVQAEALDKIYLQRWASELSVTAELARLLNGEIKPKKT